MIKPIVRISNESSLIYPKKCNLPAKLNFMKLIWTFIVFFLLFTGCNEFETNIYDLRCEYLEAPLGIGTNSPRFSWKIKSDKNIAQSAFRILVASNPKLLENNNADCWDSGRKESKSGLLIQYEGTPLQSGLAYWWKVCIWDEDGNEAGWSEISGFSVGLLNPADWEASYIAFPADDGYNTCPQLTQSFEANLGEEKLLLHVNSLGYHEVYMNGDKVGDAVLTPAVSQFNKRSHVITYDITSCAKKGKNDLMLWLGSGWYKGKHPGVSYNGAVVKAQLEKVVGTQREILLTTDDSWLGRKSSYTGQGAWRFDEFGGEVIDGKLSKRDLSPDGGWEKVSIVDIPADYQVTAQAVELNRITKTIKAVDIKPLSKDTFLIDMGTCLTGWVEIHFPKLAPEQRISMEYADKLDKNGNFNDHLNHTDYYHASGEGVEIFKNKFNYRGFRYIRLSGLEQAPGLDAIKAFLIHTDFDQISSFSCSDEDMNRIHDLIQYTLRCIGLGGYLVDCPHIERLGYGGDGNSSTVTAQTMYNMAPLYNNWLQAWADCIREDGGMPHTAPNPYSAGGGPYWCGFIITGTWNTFLNYGDIAILQKYYPVMQKWLEYVDKYSVDGLLKKWPDNDYRGWYLGDWATPQGVKQTDPVSIDLINNCFLVVCYDNLESIARILGNASDADLYNNKRDQLRELIHRTFFKPDETIYATGSQLDMIYPLLSGVVPQELSSEVIKKMEDDTRTIHKGHLATGLVGVPVITEWTIKNRPVDFMYSMLKKRDFPGYLYMLDSGATTTWEHWDGDRSHIHNCYNGIGSWFYQALGGIRQAEGVPAYGKVIIQPQVPEGITWVKASQETPYGTLTVNWELKDGQMTTFVKIPVGAEAEFIIPDSVQKYNMNGKELSGGKAVSLKYGEYNIQYSI